MSTETGQTTPGPHPPAGETELVEAALRQMESLSAAAMTLPAGDPPSNEELHSSQNFPGYEILRKIHGGGQGIVYQAIQKSTGKKVALKVFREGPFSDPRNRARIELGVRILSELDHPNIVRIIDSGESRGVMFYVMDYLAGMALHDWLDRRRSTSAATPPIATKPGGLIAWRSSRLSSRRQQQDIEELVRLFIKICDAVNAAHLRGVIHRDLKPGNIHIDERGEPHILDFDLAKIVFGDLDPQGRFAEMTQTGEFLGSLRWASPEQVERIPGKIDTRTDVYALGVILFEMVTAQTPYPILGTRRDVEDRILNSDPLRPSNLRRQIDADLDTIILKCLSKQRERRYPSAGVLADDLRSFLAGAPISARRDSTLYILKKLARRHSAAAVTIALVLSILVSTTATSIYFYRQERQAAREKSALAEQSLVQAKSSDQQAKMANDQLNRMALGWFLLEWHADRLQRAKFIRDGVAPDSAERKAMLFLLDPTFSEQRFLAELPANDSSMGLFMVGEKHLKSHDFGKARQSFQSVLQLPGSTWYREAARARILECDQRSKAGDGDRIGQQSRGEP